MIQIEPYKDGKKAEEGSLTFCDGFIINLFGCWYRYDTLDEALEGARKHYEVFDR